MKPKRTILCVDDNEQALSIRKIMLETRGYRVVACNNGEAALAAFRRGGIDLVLTDLIMPGIDGSKLIATTKANGSNIDVFGVRWDGRLSAAPVQNTSATPVPFGFVFDRSGTKKPPG